MRGSQKGLTSSGGRYKGGGRKGLAKRQGTQLVRVGGGRKGLARLQGTQSGGELEGTNLAAGYKVSGGRPEGTNQVAGYSVGKSGVRPEGTNLAAGYAFARDTWHVDVDVTAIINLSVTSQLERADFCGSDRSA